MEKMVLKPEIIERIKSEPILYGEISKELGISPLSLPRILRSNSPKLTQAGVLGVIKRNSKGVQNTNAFLQKQAN